MTPLTLEQIGELTQGDIVFVKRNDQPHDKLESDYETVGFFTTIKNKSLVLKFNAYYVEHETFDTDYYHVYALPKP